MVLQSATGTAQDPAAESGAAATGRSPACGQRAKAAGLSQGGGQLWKEEKPETGAEAAMGNTQGDSQDPGESALLHRRHRPVLL